MRVLMISKACLIGPYQRKLEEIARFPDIELMVVTPPMWREHKRIIRLERMYTTGYQLIAEPMLFNGNYHLHWYPFLGRRMRRYAPDVVHIDEEPYNLSTFLALSLARRIGARSLWFTWQNLNRRYPLPFRWIEQYNLRYADYAIVGSQGAATVWRAKGYNGPLAVIPQFGVDPHIFSPDPTMGAGDIDGDTFVIGYAGRLVPEKGVDLLLTAAAELPSSSPWRVVVVGAGPERAALEKLAQRLDVWERVTFPGSIPAAEMPRFYRQWDVCVLPSRSRSNWVEQFGRVLIEAMACGTPVIGSDCGEIPAVIGDAGLLFPEGDVKALQAHLRHLMQDRATRINLAQKGRARVLAHFTQTQIAAQTVAVYRQMISLPNQC